MTPATRQWIEAEFSKINFIMEAMWANLAAIHGASPQQVEALGDALHRQFVTLPGSTPSGSAAPANDTPVRDLAAARLQTFFAGVRARVEKFPAP